jgi:hypothetical protein
VQRVALATEDELSEIVGLRLLAEVHELLQVGLLLRKGGNGYLRSRIRNFCKLAEHQPLLLITDLDSWPCPAVLRGQWFGRLAQPTNMLVRVAVREIEAWILADHHAAELLLGARCLPRLPMQSDTLSDPKATLLALAKQATREIRSDLCFETASGLKQGIGYNARLGTVVRDIWNPRRAAAHSDSLNRARKRLREWGEGLRGH